MNRLDIPNRGIYLIDGSIVRLPSYPEESWILHYGWYECETRWQEGWYLLSIPNETTLPVTDIVKQTLIVVTVDGSEYNMPTSCNCNPKPSGCWPPSPPLPPAPSQGFLPLNNLKWDVDRAFLTLADMSQRDLLNSSMKIPDGKIVLVLDANGEGSKYYQWKADTSEWIEIEFGDSGGEDSPEWHKISE